MERGAARFSQPICADDDEAEPTFSKDEGLERDEAARIVHHHLRAADRSFGDAADDVSRVEHRSDYLREISAGYGNGALKRLLETNGHITPRKFEN